jgi:small nuclear ribonucleoprotein (snRNP)-like protein
MTFLLSFFAAAVFLGVPAAVLANRRARRPREYFRELVRRRVLVHTKDDRSIRGVLCADYEDCVVLDAPEYLGEAQVEKLSGPAVIPSQNLSWIQVLSDDGP